MPLLIYILHSGQLYGTERMALATLTELAASAKPLLLAPPGPVHAEAERHGIASREFTSIFSLIRIVLPALCSPGVKVFSTGVSQALVVWGCGLLLGRIPRQVHVVHGGADERLSYGRKRWLQFLRVELVAVSAYVRERLLAHRCSAQGVTVIENFLSGEFPERGALLRQGPLQVCMITRLDPIKQVGLAIQAWQRLPQENKAHLRICGTGWQQDELCHMAAANADIELMGFVSDTQQVLLQSDLYLHTCDREPFGLAILEAMAVGVPVLVPDQGGAALIVEHGRNGFRYRAGDVDDLQRQLTRIASLNPNVLAGIVSEAKRVLRTRFSAQTRCQDYAALLGLEVRHG